MLMSMRTSWLFASNIFMRKRVLIHNKYKDERYEFTSLFFDFFYNMKGEKTEEAHYYDHQNVGAWIVLGAFPEISIEWNFMIAWLVNNHMEPFFNSKFYRSLNEFQKNLLDEVHEADVYAH